ncbi:MAG: class I SAM-dependent methyltransferase, partial [Bacteroidota bacterium]
QITGIDLFPDFIELFNQHARERGLYPRVKGMTGSMDQLPFEEGELDLIWSEGAIYNIGFKKGLAYWRSFLKTGGYLAVTDASWFSDERPAEIENFWVNEYPEIDTIASKIDQLQKAGYLPLAAFILPENCWTTHYYEPQLKAQESFLKKYPGNRNAQKLVANQLHEAELYKQYKEFYGYGFYIGRKVGPQKPL